jgi:cytosine/adenosine deaminase-related metal-dependent hydrolase
VILLKNVWHLITMNDADERLSGVDVLIEGAVIREVGSRLEGPTDGRVIDCSSMIALPGLVNLHHHFNQTLQRNVPNAQSLELFDWLTTLYGIWSSLSARELRAAARLACAELLLTGCTTSSDMMYLFPKGGGTELIDAEIEAARELGIRFHPTRGSMSLGRSAGGLPPDTVVEDPEAILADSERLIERYHDPSPFSMLRIALAPNAPFSVSDELMRQTAELARRHGVLLHTHLAETEDENEYCMERYGVRPLELMERLGWLGRDVFLAHGVHFTDDELDLLAKTGTGIAHCPTSNMRLSSGVARVPEMLERGVRVGLAVDGSASNDSSDMLGELRNCLLLHLLTSGSGALSARDIVGMATRGGADILGRDEIGVIEPGRAADIVLVDATRVGYAGALSDPRAALVYTGFDHRVDVSIVNGAVVVEDGHLTTADEGAIVDDANEASARMLRRAGIDVPPHPRRPSPTG